MWKSSLAGITLALCSFSWPLTACTDLLRSRSPQNLPAGNADDCPSVLEGDAGVDTASATEPSPIDKEEASMEEPGALSALIASKLGAEEQDTEAFSEVSEPEAEASPLVSIEALTFEENFEMSVKACKQYLKRNDIKYETPKFPTPLVPTPLLVDGPIGGVHIARRWPNAKPMNAVMDCHLVVALLDVAKIARQLGIQEILFYSTYRPVRVPPKKCRKGRAGKRCRRLKKKYARIKRSKTSQHRFGRAIDIRWLVTSDGETLDILEDYDRRSGVPPCDYTPDDEKARRLTDFVCQIYEHRIFNVMLTPNANKAHHNHLHFDLSPGGRWHILR